MFCIDYLLSYSSRSRQIVFLINTEETVSESNRGRPGVRRLGVRERGLRLGSAFATISWEERDQDGTNTHTHTIDDKPHNRDGLSHGDCTRKGKGQTENVSDPTKWMAVGLETSVQLCHGLSLGENPLAAADCALEHNPNKGVFTLNVYRHPSYKLRFISGVRWIHCAQRPGQGRVFSEAIFKWSNSSWGLSRPSCQWRQTQTSLIDLH